MCRGELLATAHQPEQWGVAPGAAHRPVKLCDARWTALVMTAEGCVEVDPKLLRRALADEIA